MSLTLQQPITAITPASVKGPYKKRRKPCIICHKPSTGVTSFVFMADGRNKIGVPFCQQHLDNREAYATPVFENHDALERYKKEHPTLYNRTVKGKTILFLNQPRTSQEEQPRV
ncbi:MAG: hypothetical protein ACQCN3_14125 [Candidatus Bathyarchaeia archaeon]|jgi:hypothetical protein